MSPHEYTFRGEGDESDSAIFIFADLPFGGHMNNTPSQNAKIWMSRQMLIDPYADCYTLLYSSVFSYM